MKKVLLIFCSVAILFSCQKEQINEEVTTDLTSSIDINAEKYFGVFVSSDLELHGEIHVKKVNKKNYSATVELLNSEVLHFRGAINNFSSDVEFTGERGSFIINFSDKENMTSSHFNVDNKEGVVKTYPEKGVGAGIVFGIYDQDGVPSFTGTWDLITFGGMEPGHPGFMMIDDIFILHKDTHFASDTTFGDYEPFLDTCIVGGPFIGGATDGFAVVAVDQEATIFGFPGHWSMLSLPGLGIDPFSGTCDPLPPGIDGFWDWGGKSGTLTRLLP